MNNAGQIVKDQALTGRVPDRPEDNIPCYSVGLRKYIYTIRSVVSLKIAASYCIHSTSSIKQIVGAMFTFL